MITFVECNVALNGTVVTTYFILGLVMIRERRIDYFRIC